MVRHHEYAVARPRDAPVESARRIARDPARLGTLEVPYFPARARIHGPAFVGAGDVHQPFHHHRSGLRPRHPFHGEHPLGGQPSHIALVDLLQSRVPVSARIAVVGRPVLRRCHLAKAIAHGPQQMHPLIVGPQLQIRRTLIQHQPRQFLSIGGFHRTPHRRTRSPGPPQRPQEPHQVVHLLFLKDECRHPARRQPFAHRGHQLRIGAIRHPANDARAQFAAHAIAAMAHRTAALILPRSRFHVLRAYGPRSQ